MAEDALLVVGTWPFSFAAVEYASKSLLKGEGGLNAVERGVNLIEENPAFGSYQVGYGGYPNSKGDVEMDAAIMSGEKCQFGAVAGIKRVKYPISVARKVLHNSPHSLLVGSGANEFAIANQIPLIQDTEVPKGLLHGAEMSRQAPEGHDTLGLIALDKDGNIVTGVTTSGKKYKFPGRVGDAPLPGGGLYADNDIGGAVATGDGDEIIKFCPTFHVVQLMSQGHSPKHACEQVIRIISRKLAPNKMFDLGLIAVDNKGHIGAATSINEWKDCQSEQSYPGFPIVVWCPKLSSEILLDVIGPVSS